MCKPKETMEYNGHSTALSPKTVQEMQEPKVCHWKVWEYHWDG